MSIQEITPEKLNSEEFIKQKADEISSIVGNGIAINALSGGVDSSTVTLLAHKALGKRLKTYFVDNGIMREGEPEKIVSIFKNLGVDVQLIDAKKEFFDAFKGITDPEEKREALTQTFYKNIFAKLVKESGAKYLLQGTILTDVDETVAGIKRQHNVFEQLGIDPQQAFGYKIIEPLIQLRKPAVRMIAQALGLPEEIFTRPPFPGPALAARVIGEVTPERIELIRKATKITEEELHNVKVSDSTSRKTRRPFQYLAILHEDKVTGMKDNKRDYGFQIEIRCWDSKDARTASPTKLPFETLTKLADRITKEVSGVVSVTYNITPKPPSTIEAV